MFDSGLSIQIAPNGQNSWRARISKTSKNPALPVKLYERAKVGTLFQTNRGPRWCVESQGEIREFLQQIEPYVEVRKPELELMLKFVGLDPDNDSTQAELAKQWQALQAEEY